MHTPTAEQLAEMARVKGYFPFRIVYLATKGDKAVVSAVTSMRIPNKLAREGWDVSVAR